MAQRTPFTIFYAWQSDTPRAHNRDLIQSAINEARDQLNSDPKSLHQVEITSDTRGVPGLCDIPAEILNKIATADAAVLDLTFVATMDGNSKRCPNPNVLFELGYAFHAIEPKRLICVMNEALGEPTETMFDIAHRRWPIRYTSPAEGATKKEVISALAGKLKDALALMIALGTQSVANSAPQSEQQFELESTEIRSNWESNLKTLPGPTMYFTLRPRHFEKRRYANADALQHILRQHQVVDLLRRHHYPPDERGSDIMPWGLFNGLYGRPAWSLCYSGQFWATVPIGSHNEYKLSERDRSMYAYDPVLSRTFGPGQWIDYIYARVDMADAFKFAGSFAKALPPAEPIAWSAIVEGIKGTILASNSPRYLLCSRLCGSPMAYANGIVEAGEFAEKWTEFCLDLLQEFFGMFDIGGQRIDRDTLQKFLDSALAGRE